MRTIGPLHFEDLEPKRFEDLVRQLIYDFRAWRALEATGRSGSDDGFDARGFEITDAAGVDILPDDPRDEIEIVDAARDRIWLIQCKREKEITPAKMRKHLADIPAESLANLHGVIFVAACEFSKKTKDVFIKWRSDNALSEGYLWGKGELEDMLYQPKNDGLLFAYFGFSLRIRRRSLRTEVRAKLAMKRKCHRLLPSLYTNVLIRDPTDERYPFIDPAEGKQSPAGWKVRRFIGRHHRGLIVEIYSHYAYLADDEKSWDIVESIKNGPLRQYDDPWYDEAENPENEVPHQPVFSYWNKLSNKNQANLTVVDIIPYENIIDIDDKTDEIFDGPTIFVDSGLNFKRRAVIENLEQYQSVKIAALLENRIKFFPDTFPDIEPIGDAGVDDSR